MKILDLGCGRNKLKGAFGIDFVKFPGVDLAWNLNKPLPKRFNNKFDIVYHKCVLDHIGNPLDFLKNCKNYLKNNGKLIMIVDNGDYWRFHLKLGTYHADIWELDEPGHPETHHKMIFQMKHLIKMLKLIGFKIQKAHYYNDYDNLSLLKRLRRGHIDYLLSKHLGRNMIKIEAIKS